MSRLIGRGRPNLTPFPGLVCHPRHEVLRSSSFRFRVVACGGRCIAFYQCVDLRCPARRSGFDLISLPYCTGSRSGSQVHMSLSISAVSILLQIATISSYFPSVGAELSRQLDPISLVRRCGHADTCAASTEGVSSQESIPQISCNGDASADLGRYTFSRPFDRSRLRTHDSTCTAHTVTSSTSFLVSSTA